MNKLQQTIVSILTKGPSSQNFIGAAWLTFLLKTSPASRKRRLALRIIALSPHYFYRHLNPQYANLPYQQFLEAEFDRNTASRQKLCDLILKPYLNRDFVVMDYGCGPGFLAEAVSRHVKKIYAVDISPGVLACARVINFAPNIEYLSLDDIRWGGVPDRSLDMVYSFAVIQHLSDTIIQTVLKLCADKLKSGGRIILHVQLEDPNWKTEEEWCADSSLTGRIRLHCGLHCFSRTAEYFTAMLPRHGFRIATFAAVRDICREHFDDICNQHFLVAEKA